MSLRGEDALILAYDYTEKSLEGTGALKGQDGKDGVSPIISVNTSTEDTYKLDITDKNGTITTPNLVGKQGLQGIQGEQGKPADNPIITENADNTEDVYKLDLTVGETVFTTKNIIGKQGLEGVSPSVTTNPDNTAEDYRLNITTKGGTFTTPNLRGPQGEQGPQGESAASAINPRGDYDVNAEPHYTLSDYITSAEGNTYVCKKDNPDNVAPTDGTVNDEFWQVLALRGAKGESGKDGEKGADGVTFTPSIDENGVLSFTNNGGLENPEPIDIKGDNGVTFTPSIDADGYLSFTNNGNLENPEPIKVLGKDGVDGKDGIDGTTYIPSIGTVTTVESNADASAGVTVDEETKEAVFNFAIPKGENGADGFSPIVTVTETADGHNVAIEDVNGVQNFEVLNGKDAEVVDLKSFAKPSQLGLDDTSCTVVDLINAMFLEQRKDYSKRLIGIFPYVKGESEFTDLPTNISSRGQVEIFTSGWNMSGVKFTDSLNGVDYIGFPLFNSVASGVVVNFSWGKVITEDKITNKLTNNSKTTEVPNANLVANEIHGKFFTIEEYSNALAMPIGKWRVDSNAKASQMQNLPVARAGILEVKYLQGNDGNTAYTGTFKYAMLTYTVIGGNKYERAFNSDGTVGNIVDDTGWKRVIVENSNADPYSCSGYKALTGTEDLFTLPCGHYVSDNVNTTYNYPITDTSNVTAHIYVLGCLNDPANNKGYRVILYFDNKNRMYRINEWWGSFSNGWKEIATKEYVDSVTGNTFNGKSVKTLMIDLSNSSLQYTGTSDYGEVSLANYINNNINIIRVEGYYNPPSDSSYNNKYVVVAGKGSGTGIGYMSYLNGKWSFVSAKSKGGSLKGNGFIKVYYID